jgi:hypothetical protein
MDEGEEKKSIKNEKKKNPWKKLDRRFVIYFSNTQTQTQTRKMNAE